MSRRKLEQEREAAAALLAIDEAQRAEAIQRALWAGDTDELQRVAGCICCCDEHTCGPGCPAYVWGGCRGQDTMTRDDIDKWAAHYGMTREQFLDPEAWRDAT